jgi:hypothetical protein
MLASTRLVKSYRSSSRRFAAAITRALFALSRFKTTSNGSSITGMKEDGGAGFAGSCAPTFVATSREALNVSTRTSPSSNLMRTVVFMMLLSSRKLQYTLEGLDK